jgi:hypothetical protein
MSVEVQELAVRYGAAWAGHDLDAVMAMHTDDVEGGMVSRKDTYLDWPAIQQQLGKPTSAISV